MGSGKGGICRDMMVDGHWIPQREYSSGSKGSSVVQQITLFLFRAIFGSIFFFFLVSKQPFSNPKTGLLYGCLDTKTKVLDVSLKVPQISALISEYITSIQWFLNNQKIF